MKTNLDGPSGKLNPDGGFRLQVELVPCETRQQARLAHHSIANKNKFEKVVVISLVLDAVGVRVFQWIGFLLCYSLITPPKYFKFLNEDKESSILLAI